MKRDKVERSGLRGRLSSSRRPRQALFYFGPSGSAGFFSSPPGDQSSSGVEHLRCRQRDRCCLLVVVVLIYFQYTAFFSLYLL